jgi:hypothetical protein
MVSIVWRMNQDIRLLPQPGLESRMEPAFHNRSPFTPAQMTSSRRVTNDRMEGADHG